MSDIPEFIRVDSKGERRKLLKRRDTESQVWIVGGVLTIFLIVVSFFAYLLNLMDDSKYEKDLISSIPNTAPCPCAAK
jgi:hypothetical protein